MSESRINLALVFGGQSSEHAISCLTAANICAALDQERYHIVAIAIDRDGLWRKITTDRLYDIARSNPLPHVPDDLPCAHLYRDGDQVYAAVIDEDRLVQKERVDLAFAPLHGSYGEDGTIQGLFEMLGLAYVGSGVAASANAMDKYLMKVAFEAAGIPVGPYVAMRAQQWDEDREIWRHKISDLALPIFVKPARGGSSVGIVKVDRWEDLDKAIDEARRHDPHLVIEEGIVGAREIECAVLGPRNGGSIRTSPLGEIVMKDDSAFYDFEAKYLPEGQVELKIPTEVTAEELEAVHACARQAFTALGCEGLARVDVFLTQDGQVLVNEVNTMPGFTRLSMFPALWDVGGIAYGELLSDLIDQALERTTTILR